MQSESTWDGQVGDGTQTVRSDNSSTLVVPAGYLVQPINDKFAFSFTMLGVGFSDDFGDWPGRYFIESYESLSISAFPSLAYRVSDRWSVAASAAITYARFEQDRAIANVFDPGVGDGSSNLEADGVDIGFGLSTLYELSDQTRVGLLYQSEIDPTQDGKAKFENIGPNTEAVLDRLGLIGADLEVKSTSPQSLLAGIYHEFENNHALTFDVAWVDFSSFELSEYVFDGNSFSSVDGDWEDIWAFSASYSWPVSDRWMLGVGGLYVSDMVDDDERTFMLRLDSMWSLAAAAEWQWTDNRRVEFNFSYMTSGDAPISTTVPMLGQISGEFTKRDIFLLRLSVSWGGI